MPGRGTFRQLALIILVAHVWMVGAASSCHTCIASPTGERTVTRELSASKAKRGLATPRGEQRPACAACAYLLAARSAPPADAIRLAPQTHRWCVPHPPLRSVVRLDLAAPGSRAPPAA